MSDSQFQAGLFVKGEQVRRAHNASQAVALTAEGFAPYVAEDAPAAAPAPVVSDSAPVPDSTPTPGSLFGRRDKSEEDE